MIKALRQDASATGASNMAADIDLHAEVVSGALDIGMRLYTWQPWCVSLGKHQSAERLNAEALSKHGIDVVHRPTGGRAVLHADEVTYCLCVRLPDTSTAQTLYSAIHDLLFEVLGSMVPDLAHASLSDDLRTHYSSNQSIGQACFSSHAKSEILWNNRKVVGSAQRIMDGVLLQHGSILCGQGHELIAQLIGKTPDEVLRIEDALQRSSVTLSEASGRTISTAQVLAQFTENHARIESTLISIAALAADAKR